MQDPSLWSFVVLPAADDVMLPCTQARYGWDQAPRRGAMDKNEPTVQSEGEPAGSIMADVYPRWLWRCGEASSVSIIPEVEEVVVAIYVESPACILTRVSAMACLVCRWVRRAPSPCGDWRPDESQAGA